MKPKILSKDFHYTPSHSTDIRRTFRRIKAQQRPHALPAEAKDTQAPIFTLKRRAA